MGVFRLLLGALLWEVPAVQNIRLKQPSLISTSEGNSEILPCSFSAEPEEPPLRFLGVVWWRGPSGTGRPIFDSETDYVHPDYRGRASVKQDLRRGFASLSIRNLRKSDENVFLCGVTVMVEGEKVTWWRQEGTNVTFAVPAEAQNVQVKQSLKILTSEGNSAVLHCFASTRKGGPPLRVLGFSWWRGSPGTKELVFDSATNFTHRDYRNRVSMKKDLKEGFSSFDIQGLRKSDEDTFFCRVSVVTEGKEVICWSQEGANITFAEGIPRFLIQQPKALTAPEGGSVTISCLFSPPPGLGPLSNVRVIWRRNHFHGKVILRSFPPATPDPDYEGRVTLVGNPVGGNASIRISGLRPRDQTTYFCAVYGRLAQGQEVQQQSSLGTPLTVTARSRGRLISQPRSPQALDLRNDSCVTEKAREPGLCLRPLFSPSDLGPLLALSLTLKIGTCPPGGSHGPPGLLAPTGPSPLGDPNRSSKDAVLLSWESARLWGTRERGLKSGGGGGGAVGRGVK
ncbi:uncharacterized protein LOC114808087 [Ornithorhynchus anatinus]|uniref:uncharacterized protein LOC114808087 n=1 Tax=Ornithorhynchus anatinus TaxID=9258 RepID=UPI0010A805A8|nr:uncharacterized protein LOC114808087 [Ornithorhynchus anatinus]